MELTTEEIVLLGFVYDQTDRNLMRSVDPRTAPGDYEETLAVARRLIQAGLLRLPSLGDEISLTPFGMEISARLRTQQVNQPARMAALLRLLLEWLYEFEVSGEVATSTANFMLSGRAIYAGRGYSDGEIGYAVTRLRDANLISGLQADQSIHLSCPRLSPAGISCVESGKSVSDFLTPSPSAGPTFNVRVDGSQNVNVGTQSDFVQNNSSGIDPAVLAQLAHFALAARQGIPSFNLDDEQRSELEDAARQLEENAEGAAPERGVLRSLAARLVTALEPAGTSALGGIVTALGHQAVSAIS